MKEITRRLYTKPVMLGIALLVGMVMVVGLFVTAKSRAAATVYIQAGNDEFETTGNGETYHNFQASPVPAGFFGSGSKQYAGLVPLVGVPINPAVSNTDTIIRRNSDVFTPGSTTISMTALNLQSINPITVSYLDNHTENWNVKVNLSDVAASGGSMSFNSDGRAFDSSLGVYPKFTFTRVSDGAVRVLDTGSSGGGGLAPTTQSATIGGGGTDSTTAIAVCRATTANDFQTLQAQSAHRPATAAATSTSSCPPVTLTSTSSPWPITRPITEQELMASHNASPPGTKQALAQ
ncbi:MAG TPA: hypothetical protein VGK82_09465 [Pyrinomonadaceae bacterium]